MFLLTGPYCSDFPQVLCDSDKDLFLSVFLLDFFTNGSARFTDRYLCTTVRISYSAVVPNYPRGTGKMQIAPSVCEIKAICLLFLVSS